MPCNASITAPRRADTTYGASVDVVDFTVARATELRALRQAALSISGNRRVYQKLSWHLRRRTMSHSSRRMPARLRVAHARQLASQSSKEPGKSKERPPGPRGAMRLRKYRKKARFLLAFRKLRAESPAWLETHIWHAKRFQMLDLPGGRIVAEHPNDRGTRSAFRAASHASVIHDASYLDVIEISSACKSELCNALQSCLSPEDAALATVDPVVNGSRRVQNVVLLDSSGDAVAPVDILWRPGREAQLWLWVLPVTTEHVIHALQNLPTSLGPLSVTNLSGKLLTFTVIGPRAGPVLRAVLDRVESDGVEWECAITARSPASLPAGCVVVGNVEDPRETFPPKRMNAAVHRQPPAGLHNALLTGFRSVPDSLLWAQEARDASSLSVKKSKRRDLSARAVRVPFMLLNRQAGLSRGFASGWDLILPSGWGMAFWMSFMYANGSRAVGRREMRHLSLESNEPVFPQDFIDTPAGYMVMRVEQLALLERYERRPKSKRVNYSLYRNCSPFFPDLETVSPLGDQSDSTGAPPRKRSRALPPPSDAEAAYKPKVALLRSVTKLRLALNLGTMGDALNRGPQAGRSGRRGTKWQAMAQGRNSEMHASSAQGAIRPSTGLFVRVTLRPCGKGLLEANAMLCTPLSKDFQEMKEQSTKYGGFREKLAHRGRGDVTPSRDVIGYVTNGAYSLARGGGVASGALSLLGLKHLLMTNDALPAPRGGAESGVRSAFFLQVRVLFRNPSSLQYRSAVATVRL